MVEIAGIFGRHFQSPNVRGQVFFQIFVCFFVAGILSEGVFSILKEQDWNKISFCVSKSAFFVVTSNSTTHFKLLFWFMSTLTNCTCEFGLQV